MKLRFTAAFVALAASPAVAEDFGMTVQQILNDKTPELFGFAAPLAATAQKSGEDYRTPEQSANDQVDLAEGLTASYLSRELGNKADMMALFPLENPTHLIVCIEGDREVLNDEGKLNPAVQSVSLADGTLKTLFRGTTDCDGIRTTPWNTILATEEEGDGGAYEIFDPLSLEDVVLLDRGTGATTDPEHIFRHHALPVIAWEGLTITREGVVYAGDELRPGSSHLSDSDGGSIFKFVPETAWDGSPVASGEESPFAAGTVYAMQVQCVEDEIQFGQGCEVGNAAWIEVDAKVARREADTRGATGYYRPEDLHTDPVYAGEGVRFCWTNTQREKAQSYGEVMCAVDTDPTGIQTMNDDGEYSFTTVTNRFVEGDPEMNSVDNLAFQPSTGNVYVIEDHSNGDVWACLPDGADRDIKSDGCVRMLSVKDSEAEPSGFMFSADGKTAYVNIQHSDDGNMPKYDDYKTDDLLIITGFTE